MKKRVKILVSLVASLFLISCGKSSDGESVNMDMKKAHEVSNKYLQMIYDGDIEGAKSLLSKDLKKSTKTEMLEGLTITSFSEIEQVEAAKYIASKYKITRADETTTKASVDIYSIKIIDEKGEYKVSEAKGETLKSVYGEGSALRVRRNNAGESELLIRLKDFPSEMYIKEDGAQINKYNLPNKSFGVIGMGALGGKIGVTTTDGINTYVALVIDEDAKASFATVDTGGQQKGEEKKSIDEIIEKPVAQQLNSIDLIKNAVVQKIQFDGKEKNIIVQYQRMGKGKNIKVYNSSSAEIIPLELDKKFPEDKYSVDVSKIDGEEIFIKVSLISGGEDDKSGQYKLDYTRLEVIKE